MRHCALATVVLVGLSPLGLGGTAAAEPGNGIPQQVAALEQRVSDLEVALGQALEFVEALAPYVRVEPDPINGLVGPHVIFEGANVHVRSGSGATDGAPNGVGNLLVGYNEEDAEDRSGSHNLVVGQFHTYSSYGGFVAGIDNAVTGAASSVSGGRSNDASGDWSSVSGGLSNDASGLSSSVSGGIGNDASGALSSVSGGQDNDASGLSSSVSGGQDNEASGLWSSVSGGFNNDASGLWSSVSGGRNNDASGDWSSVSGGFNNDAPGAWSSVSGGQDNDASGLWSSVSGGANRTAATQDAWAAGSLLELN